MTTEDSMSTPGDGKGEEKLFYRFLESDLRSDFPRGAETVFISSEATSLVAQRLRGRLRHLAHPTRTHLFPLEASYEGIGQGVQCGLVQAILSSTMKRIACERVVPTHQYLCGEALK